MILVSLVVAVGAQEYFQQLVDHFSPSTATYKQKYFKNDTYFGGPGYPIICIVGGEGGLDGLLYPWVLDVVAKDLGALVVEPEHRYYGDSRPAGPLTELLTPQQALADAAYFVQWVRDESGAGDAVAIGGSYPGFLAAAARLRYPGVFQAAYAASAPVLFYAQQVDDPFAYYRVVTQSAEDAVPGCADALRKAIAALDVDAIDVCDVPSYAANATILRQELTMVLMYTMANLNMANYPPGPATSLSQACQAAVNGSDVVHELLFDYAQKPGQACFNLTAQLPTGSNATVSGGDWSGDGTGSDGESWDFQTSSFLVETIGTNGVTDCFPPRNFTLDWLQGHAQARFQVDPQPTALVDLWGFDDLASVTSNIYFTNGLNDGWSVAGITTNLSDTLIAFNIEGGAHHSDLAHSPPSEDDLPGVVQARQLGLDLLRSWLRSPAHT